MKNSTPHSTAQSFALSETTGDVMDVDRAIMSAASAARSGVGDPNLTEAWRAWRAAESGRLEKARATECGIPGCNHDHADCPMDEQLHCVSRTDFDAGLIEMEINYYEGTYHAEICLEGVNSDLSPSDLRAKADLYEALPTVLREQADRLEGLLIGEATC